MIFEVLSTNILPLLFPLFSIRSRYFSRFFTSFLFSTLSVISSVSIASNFAALSVYSAPYHALLSSLLKCSRKSSMIRDSFNFLVLCTIIEYSGFLTTSSIPCKYFVELEQWAKTAYLGSVKLAYLLLLCIYQKFFQQCLRINSRGA